MFVGRATECARVDRLLRDVGAGHSGVLVLLGDPGIGKTSLLDYAERQGSEYRTIRIRGVESEMELPFAGLHLFSLPLLGGLAHLPVPQRDAIETALGLANGSRPDLFLVGLATLSLLSDAAEAQPLLCIVDDAHWLDRSSAQVLAFVARRLEAERVALLFAEGEAQRLPELDDLPALRVQPLSDRASRELISSLVAGPLDESVRERIVAECHGNPLALLELPTGMSPIELAGGFGVGTTDHLPDKIEQSYRRRLNQIPVESQQLALLAAADPVGDPALLSRAAAELGIRTDAADPIESSGLVSLGQRVVFRHPLLRAAIYQGASSAERRRAHRALARATDPVSDPDRRAWHLALAAEGPDEEVAEELERSATRAEDRGGLPAAAAFLEKAALLTADSQRRAERALAAAEADHAAAQDQAAERLLAIAETGPADRRRSARIQRLHGKLAFDQRLGGNSADLLLKSAQQLEQLDPELSRLAYLEALAAAIFAGRLGPAQRMIEVAEAALAAPRSEPPPTIVDLLVEGLAVRITQGYADAVAPLGRALLAIRGADGSEEATRCLWLASRVAADLWDEETWDTLTDLDVRLAREAGALTVLPYALNYRAVVDVLMGRFAVASALVEEADAIRRAASDRPLRQASLTLAAWQGNEGQAMALFDSTSQEALHRGVGITLTSVAYSTSVLNNGLGRYDKALRAARDAAEFDELQFFGWTLVELIEAASRCGDYSAAEDALARLSERTRLSRSEWALGIEARSRALVSRGEVAEDLYAEAIERLRRSRITAHLARAYLLYGEWLRRQGRRTDARTPLRTAYEAFSSMGANAFAERARRELLAAGEKASSRIDGSAPQLTSQEAQIASLVCAGLTNPEIGTRLFLSPRTIEYHLHKVFAKLGISSRTELHLYL